MKMRLSIEGKSPAFTLSTIIATTLVIVGFMLTSISWWFLLICAAGAFGPGLLREMRCLRDMDEFQRQVAHRSAYHAYLSTGILTFILMSYLRSNTDRMVNAESITSLLLCVLWFTYLFSSLIGYWGAKVAAYRTLVLFGTIWFVFTILSNTGSEWTGWTSLILHPLLSLPFFLLAFLSQSRPRISSMILIASSVFMCWFFGLFQATADVMITRSVTAVLFVGPLLGSGLALFLYKDDEPVNGTDASLIPAASS